MATATRYASCLDRSEPRAGGYVPRRAWLVDRVLPEVPVRQWVLTLPFALRYRLAYDAELTAAVQCEFLCAVFAALRRRARRVCGVPRGQCGAVVFVQRFGDALNLNVHFHAHGPPSDAELAGIARRVARALTQGDPGVPRDAGSAAAPGPAAPDCGDVVRARPRVVERLRRGLAPGGMCPDAASLAAEGRARLAWAAPARFRRTAPPR